MSEKAFYISTLIHKKLKAEISAEEEIELNEWLHQPENKKVFEELSDENWIKQELEKFDGYDAEKIKERVKTKIEEENENKVHPLYPKAQRFNWKRVAAAAAVIVVVSASVFYFTLQRTQHNQPVAIEKPVLPDDVKAPESNRAMVTLANGQKVYLDSVNNGQLAVQGSVQLVKLANGKIAYTGEQGVASGELVYNTLTNPRGSKVIDMMLADGSHVWLNAGSSVTYPVAFAGNERKVEITGEAYFEVAHDATKPFIVSKGEMSVQVLGTHFNVNAYDDEPNIKVTLLEGSVLVKRQTSNVRLIPGQQATVIANGAIGLNKDVDLEEVMAWKNGEFQFGEKADIQTIMRQIARWYNVDVEYRGKVSGYIGGSISRNVNASKVLEMLQKTGEAKFRVEGNKVIVMP